MLVGTDRLTEWPPVQAGTNVPKVRLTWGRSMKIVLSHNNTFQTSTMPEKAKGKQRQMEPDYDEYVAAPSDDGEEDRLGEEIELAGAGEQKVCLPKYCGEHNHCMSTQDTPSQEPRRVLRSAVRIWLVMGSMDVTYQPTDRTSEERCSTCNADSTSYKVNYADVASLHAQEEPVATDAAAEEVCLDSVSSVPHHTPSSTHV